MKHMQVEIKILFQDQLNIKDQIKDTLFRAYQNLIKFNHKHELCINLDEPLIDEMIVYETQAKLIKDLMHHFNLEDDHLFPKTFVATVDQKTLFIVSPKAYGDIFPTSLREENTYEKLITHELSHLMHVRFLNGEEDEMGPEWLFEGFAMYVADQFKDTCIEDEQLIENIKHNQTADYKTYSAMFRSIANKIPMKRLLNQAKSVEFSKWVINHYLTMSIK